MVSLRLLHIDLGIYVTIQESVFNIQLDDSMLAHCCYCQQHTSCGVVADRGEDLVEVLTLYLSKSLRYEASFELLQAAISIGLDLEHPFYSNRFLARWELCKFPSASLQQGMHLLVHCLLPLISVRTRECFIHSSGFRRQITCEKGFQVAHVEGHAIRLHHKAYKVISQSFLCCILRVGELSLQEFTKSPGWWLWFSFPFEGHLGLFNRLVVFLPPSA